MSDRHSWESELRAKLVVTPSAAFDTQFWGKFEREFLAVHKDPVSSSILVRWRERLDDIFRLDHIRYAVALSIFILVAATSMFKFYGAHADQFPLSQTDFLQSSNPVEDLDLMLALESNEVTWADIDALAKD